MNIEFKVDAVAFREAINIVRAVRPAPIQTDGACGYLFVIGKKPTGGDCGWVYSRDGICAAGRISY